MALLVGKLKPFKRPYPGAGRYAATHLAQNYDEYARAAVAGASAPSFTGGEWRKIEARLLRVFGVANPDISRFANELAAGVAEYWTSPAVTFSGPGTGPVTSISAAATIPPLIRALMGSWASLDRANAVVAQALHAGTLTGIATLTYPGPPPVVIPTALS